MLQAAVTYVLANRIFHALGKDYFMLHKILCGFITVHSPPLSRSSVAMQASYPKKFMILLLWFYGAQVNQSFNK